MHLLYFSGKRLLLYIVIINDIIGKVNSFEEGINGAAHKFFRVFFVQFSVFEKELKNVCIICEFVVFY